MKNKLVAWVLILTLLCGLSAYILDTPVAFGANDDVLAEFQKEQDALNKSIAEQRAKLKESNKKLNVLNAQVKELELDISASEQQVKLLKKNLVAADVQMQVANSQLAAAEKKMNSRMKNLKDRLRESYINGQVSMVDVFLESNSMEDFLTQSYYLEKIMAHDTDLLAEIEGDIKVIELKKQDIATKQANISTMKGLEEQSLQGLEAQQVAKNAKVSEAEQTKESVQQALDQFEADSRAIAKKIRALQSTSGGQGTGKLGWPLPGHTRVTSDYGMRIHPITKKRAMHTGIDLPAPKGTKVLAADSGTVLLAGDNGAYGRAVIIDHGNKISTLYGHNSKLLVSAGQKVTKGDTIALVGSTGWSTGNHLHFEVRKNGDDVSPWNYVKKP